MDELHDDEAVLAACGNSPLIAHLLHTRVPGRANAWRLGDATAVLFGLWHHDMLAVVGERDAGALATELAAELPGMPTILPEAHGDALGDREEIHLGFCWTDTSPGADADAAQWLPPGDETDRDVNAVLDAGFPTASIRPGPDAKRWAGIRDDGGRLVACIADASPRDDMGYCGSLAVHPDARGQRYGDKLLRWTVDRLVAEHGRVGFWWYSADTMTRDWYGRLGFSQLPMADGRLRSAAA